MAACVLGEARQTSVVDATEFAVDVGGLHIWVRERCDGAWIFGGPIQAGSGQELKAVVDARSHAKAVKFNFVDPLRPDGGLSTGRESWGGTNCGRGASRRLRPERDGPDLMACEAERSTTQGIAGA